jgi:hypothetical protein
MEQNPFWEANSDSAGQELTHLLWSPVILLNISQELSIVP